MNLKHTYNFSTNNSNNNDQPVFNFYDLKELNNKNYFMDYNELLAMEMLSYEELKQKEYFMANIKTDDFHNFMYSSFHAGVQKMINDGYYIVKINGESNSEIKFNKQDIDFISYKALEINDKQYNTPILFDSTENVTKIKKLLYEDKKKIDKLNNLIFFSFMPYLNENNNFYYSIILGLKVLNYDELFSIKFNLLKNVNFINLTSQHLSYEFFRNFFNIEKNLFINGEPKKDFFFFGLNSFNPSSNDLFTSVDTRIINYYYLKLCQYSKFLPCSFFFGNLGNYYFGSWMDWLLYESKGYNDYNYVYDLEFCSMDDRFNI